MIEFALQGAVFALALTAGACLLLRHRSGPAPWLAAIAAMGLGAFAVASTRNGLAVLGPAIFVFDAWCLATPVVLFLLAQAMFRDGFRLNAAFVLAFAPLVVIQFVGDWGHGGSATMMLYRPFGILGGASLICRFSLMIPRVR